MSDREHDDRWDELALGHVLGGLGDADASAFRGHLASCGPCRARVAELRSMASDLAAAEREERATLRLRTQVSARRDPVEDQDREPVQVRRRVLVAAGTIVLVLLVLTMWNAHLRGENSQLRELAATHARTLTAIGGGSVVPAQSSGGITGVVAVDGDRVAWSLAGLPVPAAGERLVVWLRADGDWQQAAVYTPVSVDADDGRVAASAAVPGATRLVVTVESLLLPPAPTGEPVLEADLDTVADA